MKSIQLWCPHVEIWKSGKGSNSKLWFRVPDPYSLQRRRADWIGAGRAHQHQASQIALPLWKQCPAGIRKAESRGQRLNILILLIPCSQKVYIQHYLTVLAVGKLHQLVHNVVDNGILVDLFRTYKNFRTTNLAHRCLDTNLAQDLGAHHCAPLVHKNDAAAQGTSHGDEDSLLGCASVPSCYEVQASLWLQDQWDNMNKQLHAEHTNYLSIFVKCIDLLRNLGAHEHGASSNVEHE